MAPVASSTRSQVRTSAGTSSASACSARRCSSASVRAPTIDRAHPYAAPTSVSASQGMATPLTIHPLGRPPSLSAVTLRRLLGLGFPVVRRVEPGALVARSERLKHALDLLPGRRAADQAVLGHPLLDLERRAVLAAVSPAPLKRKRCDRDRQCGANVTHSGWFLAASSARHAARQTARGSHTTRGAHPCSCALIRFASS